MKISKNSWHYRLLRDYYYMEPAEGLCQYFWETVFLTIGLPFFLIKKFICDLSNGWKWFLAILYSVVSLPVTIYLNGIVPTNGLLIFPFVVAIVISSIGVLFLIFLLILLLMLGPRYLYEKIKPKKTKDKNSLLKEFIKAKWNRVCPRLEFVDEDEE